MIEIGVVIVYMLGENEWRHCLGTISKMADVTIVALPLLFFKSAFYSHFSRFNVANNHFPNPVFDTISAPSSESPLVSPTKFRTNLPDLCMTSLCHSRESEREREKRMTETLEKGKTQGLELCAQKNGYQNLILDIFWFGECIHSWRTFFFFNNS